ncbi:MAG: dTMP kinase, partial [Oscillospiraceae bacterium]|nr:dTMP kinase [Oscillospiraceae bacterium]
MAIRRGKFIVFEGIDGSGKTTQLQNAKEWWESAGCNCMVTREPSDGEAGKLIRQYLAGKLTGADSHYLAALFAADRLDHILKQNGMLEFLNANPKNVILCDRYYLSNYAYQSVDVDLDWLIAVNSVSAQICKPDCHIYIDVTPETAFERIKTRGNTELFEKYERLKSTAENYLKTIEKLPEENIIIINGENNCKTVCDDIEQIFERM